MLNENVKLLSNLSKYGIISVKSNVGSMKRYKTIFIKNIVKEEYVNQILKPFGFKVWILRENENGFKHNAKSLAYIEVI